MKKLFRIIGRNLIYLFYGKGISFFSKIGLKFKKKYQAASISFWGKPFQYSDASSFVAIYEELFIKNIYLFTCKTDAPYILDCGANLGVGVISFKQQYPKARIKAFEPDSTISRILQKNMDAQGYTNVEVVPKAIWTHDGEILFHEQGGSSGSIVEEGTDSKNIVRLPCVRLKNLLQEKVDFLKIDIEGAEYEVLVDCKDELKNVEKMFVEYHSEANKPQKLDEILRIISDAGFRYHIQEAYSASPQPFLHIDIMKIEGVMEMDLQLNIYCYRV